MSRFWDFLHEQRLSDTEKNDAKKQPAKKELLELEVSEHREALEVLYELLLQNNTINKQTLIDSVLKRQNKPTKKEETEFKVSEPAPVGKSVNVEVNLDKLNEKKISEDKDEIKKPPKERVEMDLDIETKKTPKGHKEIDLDSKADFGEDENFEDALKKLKGNKIAEPKDDENKIKKAASDYQKGKAKEKENIDWDRLL